MKTSVANPGAFLKLILVLAFVVLAGCSRKSESSNITIALPDFSALDKKQTDSRKSVSAQAIEVVTSRIMINVTGPDISVPVVYIWDLNSQPRDSSGAFAKAPETVSIDVTRGPNRVFQVLVIREILDTDNEDSSGPLAFYYGDETRSISDSSTSLILNLSARGTSAGAEGSISGRYFNADGTSPTGKINMYYAPPGKPEMIVDQSQTMFSGFFRVFLPADLDFTYRIAGSGTPIFDKINTSTSYPNTSAVVKIQVPGAWRNRSSGTARSNTTPRTKVAGFFGYGNSARSTCFSMAPATLPNLYTSAVISDFTEVPWLWSSTNTTDARVESGGVGTATGACAGLTDFGNDHFMINTRNISFGDSPMGFQGPFRELTEGSSQYLAANHTGSVARFQWKYLKPTLGNSVAGVGIFHRTYDTVAEANARRWGDSVPCTSLTKLGFSEVSRVPFGSLSTPVEQYDTDTIRSAPFNSGRYVAIVCPYSPSGAYHDFGLVARGPTGGYVASATKIIAKVKAAGHVGSVGDETKIGQSVCAPIEIRTADADGNPAYRQTVNGAVPQVMLSVSGGLPVEFFDNNICNGVGLQSLTVSMYNPDRTVFVKTDDSVFTFPVAVTDATSGGTAMTPTLAHLAAVPKATPTNLRSVVSTSAIVAHQCYPIDFVRGTMSGVYFVPQAMNSANPTFASNIASYPGLGFFSNGSCEGGQPSGAYFSGSAMSTVPMYFKYTGAASSISIAPDGGSYTTTPLSLTVTQPGPVTQAVIAGPNSYPAEHCIPFRVQLRDAQGRPSVIGASPYEGQISFSSTAPSMSGLYSDYACTTARASLVQIPASDSQSETIYVRWTTLGSMSIHLSTSVPAVGIPNTSLATNVTAATASYIGVATPGVTLDLLTGTYLGSGPQVIMGVAMTVLQFSAVTPLGNLVTGFNDSTVTPNGINLMSGGSSVSCPPLNWVNGQALANCTLPLVSSYMITSFSTGGNSKYQYHTTPPQLFSTPPAADFQTGFYARSGTYAVGSCIPLLVTRRSVNQYPTLAATPLMLPLSSAAGISAFYSDSNCSSTTTTATIGMFNSATVVYMKTLGSPGPQPLVDGLTPLDPISGTAPSWTSGTFVSASNYMLTMETQSKLLACEPLLITRTDASGGIGLGVATTVEFSQSGIGAKFYSNGTCSGTEITSVLFATTDTSKIVYVKSNTAGSGSISVFDTLSATGSIPMITVGY